MPSVWDLYDVGLFLFFFTLHADQLNLNWGGFTIRFNQVVALLLLVSLGLRLRLQILSFNRFLGYALGFLTVSILLSWACSPYTQRCTFFTAWFGATLLGYLVLPYLLVQNYSLNRLWKLYRASFLLVGIYGVLQLLASVGEIYDPFCGQRLLGGRLVRPNAFAYEPSYFALYMTPFVMGVNFSFLVGKASFSRTYFLCVNGLYLCSTATTVIFAYALFILLVSLIALIPSLAAYFPQLKRNILSFLALLSAFFGLSFLLFPHFMKQYFFKFFISGFMMHHSFYERWIGIKNGWHIFCQHPFCGVGLGGVPPFLCEAWLQQKSQYIFLWDNQVSNLKINLLKLFEPSNVLIEILASLGGVGLLAFLFLNGLFIRQVKRSFAQDPVRVMGLALSVWMMLLVLQFNQGLLRTYVWTHFALAFALLEKIGSETSVQSLVTPLGEDEESNWARSF